MKKPKCKSCGCRKKYKNRYIIVAGEMGSQELLDRKTGKTFWGDSEKMVNELIKELNRLDAEESK
jgi:hypothetical protein